jgi:hypothetical protein
MGILAKRLKKGRQNVAERLSPRLELDAAHQASFREINGV